VFSRWGLGKRVKASGRLAGGFVLHHNVLESEPNRSRLYCAAPHPLLPSASYRSRVVCNGASDDWSRLASLPSQPMRTGTTGREQAPSTSLFSSEYSLRVASDYPYVDRQEG